MPSANVVPRNGFEVDHMQLLLERVDTGGSAQECVLKCCELGSEICQYVWIVWSQCFAVSCTPTSSACAPIKMPTLSFNSIYFRVTSPGTTGGLSSQIPSLDDRLFEFEGREGVSTNRPPVANAGPDVTIAYPKETSVTLDGTSSTDDEGITYYLWHLTAEDHLDQATLINPSLPVLKVLHLTPGLYTFMLTVADTSLQMSSDTVSVHVVARGPEMVSTAPAKAPSTEVASSPDLPPSPAHTSNPVLIEEELDNLTNSTTTPDESKDLYTKQSNLLKIVVPVLFFVALILVVSAVVVGMSFCFCERNRRQMKHLYQYKRLPGTIEKT